MEALVQQREDRLRELMESDVPAKGERYQAWREVCLAVVCSRPCCLFARVIPLARFVSVGASITLEKR